MQGPKEKCPHTTGPCYTFEEQFHDYRSKADGYSYSKNINNINFITYEWLSLDVFIRVILLMSTGIQL